MLIISDVTEMQQAFLPSTWAKENQGGLSQATVSAGMLCQMTAAGKKDEMQSTEQGKELTSPEQQPCLLPLDHTFAATQQLSLPLSPSFICVAPPDEGTLLSPKGKGTGLVGHSPSRHWHQKLSKWDRICFRISWSAEHPGYQESCSPTCQTHQW